ncbi:MAG: TRAP transporter large permease subunit, partial [Alphaproteobacteria bacterium]|nr:TRAP transporter large permease subunit [Alphaproteobacteria bacterium]
IPPSIIMVIYGILTQTNIGHLFIAGVIPRILGMSLYTVLFGALMFSKLLTMSGMADGILAWVKATGLTGVGLMAVILCVFLVLGCVMDSLAIMLIFVPLFTPLVVSQGFDLVWFGVIVVVVTEIALITPPVGMNVFVLKAVLPDVPILRIFKGLTPFIAADVIRLTLLVLFPSISLWLVYQLR